MKIKGLLIKFTIVFVLLPGLFGLTGCSMISSAVDNLTSVAGIAETGTVTANTAQIRSSYAVVAADLLEVKRGERLDVLEQFEFEKVLWYRVRANDEDKTEGWVEAQNIITSELLEKSKEIAEEVRQFPSQANGQLRAASNLRLTPELVETNLIYKLDNGSTFEIVDWKYVEKDQTIITDDSSNPKRKKTKNEEIEAAKEANEPEKIEDKYDIWYRVRLDPSTSPATAGWLFGRQVELQVPSDIVFYQNNTKKFVTWQRLDSVSTDGNASANTTPKISRPGSWVILSRTNEVKARNGIEPDFDGILFLGYDKIRQEHYTIKRIEGVWGTLPLKVEGTGDGRTVSIQLLSAEEKLEEKRFTVFRESGNLKATVPDGILITDKK